MSRVLVTSVGAALLATVLGSPAPAQQQRPQIETKKVDGTENVYTYRNGNSQSMFIVTKDGVIATDPVAYGRPNGGQQYLDEIRKVTDKPVKYLIYSHVHFDHIAGGKAFKDAGARVIAHKNATDRLKVLQDPHVVMPDESVSDRGRTIRLGGTTLELKYAGRNHSDSTLVMWLPKEKIIFVVDLIPIGTFFARGMIDFYPLEAEDLDQEDHRDGLGSPDSRPSRRAGRPVRHQGGRQKRSRAAAGRLRRRQDDGPRRQMLGHRREGTQAAEVREHAGLCQRHPVRGAALLRAVGPRQLARD